jgi:hypothetical protein
VGAAGTDTADSALMKDDLNKVAETFSELADGFAVAL